jgi:glycosyltransferase involved in cell wall biosynthesis
LVEDGVSGFLCEARNFTSLAEAMRKLARLSPQERRRMGQAARATVEQRYSEEFVVRAYLDALAELAPRARTSEAPLPC